MSMSKKTFLYRFPHMFLIQNAVKIQDKNATFVRKHKNKIL